MIRWFNVGLLSFLLLLLLGIGTASLVKPPKRSLIPLYEIQRNPLHLQEGGNDSDLGFTDYTRIQELSYGPNGYRNTLDLYMPQTEKSPLPIVIYIHGGGGDKGKNPVSAAIPLLARGYAIAQINYRPENLEQHLAHAVKKEKVYDFPAQIEDCKAAVRFIRAHAEKYGLDPERVGAMGHSMGGYLSALLCTTSNDSLFNNGIHGEYSSSIQAACSWNGPTDLSVSAHEKEYHAACFSNEWAFNQREHFSVLYAKGSLRLAAKASPITYASEDDPPILLLAGFNDTLVPPHQSNALYIQLRNAGAKPEIWIVPGGNHDGPTIFNADTRKRAANFFDRHL